MNDDQTLQIKTAKRVLQVLDADLSGSTFEDVKLEGSTFLNVNLRGMTIKDAAMQNTKISQANLTGAAIFDSNTSGMTIDGVSVADLQDAYRASKRPDSA